MLADGGGAQIIYSAAPGHQSALHAGAFSRHYLLTPLGLLSRKTQVSGLPLGLWKVRPPA
jgi:hypothetical protein